VIEELDSCSTDIAAVGAAACTTLAGEAVRAIGTLGVERGTFPEESEE
jgi:hypothetical protein